MKKLMLVLDVDIQLRVFPDSKGCWLDGLGHGAEFAWDHMQHLRNRSATVECELSELAANAAWREK